jgi:hypothetical protein
LDLAIEVIDVGALQLFEVLQLLSVAELHVSLSLAEGLLGDGAFLVGWRVNGLSPAPPLVVEKGNLLAPQTISLGLIRQV